MKRVIAIISMLSLLLSALCGCGRIITPKGKDLAEQTNKVILKNKTEWDVSFRLRADNDTVILGSTRVVTQNGLIQTVGRESVDSKNYVFDFFNDFDCILDTSEHKQYFGENYGWFIQTDAGSLPDLITELISQSADYNKRLTHHTVSMQDTSCYLLIANNVSLNPLKQMLFPIRENKLLSYDIQFPNANVRFYFDSKTEQLIQISAETSNPDVFTMTITLSTAEQDGELTLPSKSNEETYPESSKIYDGWTYDDSTLPDITVVVSEPNQKTVDAASNQTLSDGVFYFNDCPVHVGGSGSELQNAGFSAAETTVEPNSSLLCEWVNNSDNAVSALLQNPLDHIENVENTTIIEFAVMAEALYKTAVVFPGGLTINSDIDDAISVYGEPSEQEGDEESGYVSVFYYLEDREIEIGFYNHQIDYFVYQLTEE